MKPETSRFYLLVEVLLLGGLAILLVMTLGWMKGLAIVLVALCLGRLSRLVHRRRSSRRSPDS